MGRPQTVTLERIVSAGLRIAEEEGLDGLSIRRLATELGASHAAMYWHVADKDALVDLIWDAALADAMSALAPSRPADRWDVQLLALSTSVWQVYRRYAGLAVHALSRQPLHLTEHALRLSEEVLALLAAGGVADADLVPALLLLQQLTAASALLGGGGGIGESRLLEGLDTGAAQAPARFPHVVAASRAAALRSDLEVFQQGFDALLRGLTSARPHGRRVPTRRARKASASGS